MPGPPGGGLSRLSHDASSLARPAPPRVIAGPLLGTDTFANSEPLIDYTRCVTASAMTASLFGLYQTAVKP